MIDRTHELPLTRQAELVGISRGSVYYLPAPVSAADLALMRRIDELHLEHPYAGARMLRDMTAVVDWATRKVLAHRVSISMEADFCVAAVEEAIARYGKPEIFNTDQGSQFTGEAFTGLLKQHGIAISMDGKGSWRDNVFVERLWRTIKYDEVSQVPQLIA